MVIITLPSWYVEAEEILDKAIYKIMQEQNLKLSFVQDSKAIEEGKSHVLNALVRIYEDAKPELDPESLKHFRDLERIEKEEMREKKNKEIKNESEKD